MLTSRCEPFCIRFKDGSEEQTYKFACLYIGKTELYDRSLTDLRNPNDPTETYIPNELASESNRYMLQVHREIIGEYGIKWKDIQEQIHKHINYSAQMWVDEYKRLWCNK